MVVPLFINSPGTQSETSRERMAAYLTYSKIPVGKSCPNSGKPARKQTNSIFRAT